MDLFPNLPDETRTWFYCANRVLTSDEQRTVLDNMREFVDSWESHGRKVIGDTSILMNRIIVVAGIIPDGDVSGCGIDASTQRLKSLAGSIGFRFTTPLDVLYRTRGEILNSANRQLFRQRLAESGNDSKEIVIYDVSVTSLEDVRGGLFEVPLQKSWFGRFLSPDPA